RSLGSRATTKGPLRGESDDCSRVTETRFGRLRRDLSPRLPARGRLAVRLGWHAGAPYESQYFMMIVGVYATLGVFLLIASRNPQAHRSLIWFTVWSSVVHGGIMAVQSMPAEHAGHLLGDVPALFLVAMVLGGLLVWSDAGQAKAA